MQVCPSRFARPRRGLPTRHATPAPHLARPAGLDPTPGRAWLRLPRRGRRPAARGCRAAGPRPGDPACLGRGLGLPLAERPPAGGRHRRRRPTAVPLPPRLACPAGRGEVRPDARVRHGADEARELVLADLGREGMPLERACAAAVRLLDLGYFRIGNDVYADSNGSFGLTTLERRHVRRRQDRLVFTFVGKSGVEHRIEIDDRVVVAAIEAMRRRRGEDARLLAYKEGRSWRSILPELVNDYVRESTGL